MTSSPIMAATTPALALERLGPHLSRVLGLSLPALVACFRPATTADIAGVLSLRKSVIGPGLWWNDDEFVRWRYFDEHYGGSPRPYWVLDYHGELIGAVGLEPVTLVVDGTSQPATRTLDIMVRPDFDGRGIGGFMNLLLLDRFPITSVTGSNSRSHKLISRTWQQTLYLHVWKLLIDSHPYVKRYVPRGLSSIVASAANAGLAADRWLRRPRVPAGVELRHLAAFDDELDRLSASHEGPGRIGVRRTAAYLNWRFVRNPRCRYYILAAFENARMAAYVVYRLNVARPNPDREGDIVDWMPYSETGSSYLTALFHAAVSDLSRRGARIVSCWSSDAAAAVHALIKTGFRKRPDERLPFFVRATSPDLHQRLAIGGDWRVTSGDFDVE